MHEESLAEHALAEGQRCRGCERDYAEGSSDATAREGRFAPPIAILAGGCFSDLLLPGASAAWWGATLIGGVRVRRGCRAGAGL